jgi:hypothetical protein
MVAVLHRELHRFGAFGSKSLAELGLVRTRTIHSVTVQQSLIDAFKIMRDRVCVRLVGA